MRSSVGGTEGSGRGALGAGSLIAGIVGVACAAGTALGATGPTGASAARGFAIDPLLVGHALAAVVILAVLWMRDVIRPGSPARAGVRTVRPHPWWVYLACAALVYIVQGLGAAIFLGSPPAMGVRPTARAQAIAGLGAYGAGLACALVLLRLVRSSAKSAGLSVTPQGLVLGLLYGAFAWPIVQVVSTLAMWVHRGVTGDAPERLGHPTLRMLADNPADPWAWTLIGLAVLAAPINEEVIYRGFTQSAALRAVGRVWWAVLLAALAFGAAHLGQTIPVYSVVTITFLGLAMGLGFERAKNLGVPIGMHIMFNGTNVAVMLMA